MVGPAMMVGEWAVDPVSGQISRDGEIVRVDARLMRLLMCLAARAGEVVTTEELLAEVWSGVVVTQDSVYQAVASLRRALGDDPKKPAYVATVPRRGYRLVARVERGRGEGEAAGCECGNARTGAALEARHIAGDWRGTVSRAGGVGRPRRGAATKVRRRPALPGPDHGIHGPGVLRRWPDRRADRRPQQNSRPQSALSNGGLLFQRQANDRGKHRA